MEQTQEECAAQVWRPEKLLKGWTEGPGDDSQVRWEGKSVCRGHPRGEALQGWSDPPAGSEWSPGRSSAGRLRAAVSPQTLSPSHRLGVGPALNIRP